MRFSKAEEAVRLRQELVELGVREVKNCLILQESCVTIGFEDAQRTFGYAIRGRSTGLIPEFGHIRTDCFFSDGTPAQVVGGLLRSKA